MTKEKIELYHDALADILCWIDGYCAAEQSGRTFERLNILSLRELKSDLYGKLWGVAPDWLRTGSNDESRKS